MRPIDIESSAAADPRAGRGVHPFPSRRTYQLLALAFGAFAIYGSLLPFDFHPLPLSVAWDQFADALFSGGARRRFSRSDLLANILLFVPIGFTAAGALLADTGRRGAALWASAAIVPASVALSATAEFLQIFAAERVPSRLDIAAQTFGCLAGIAVWVVVGPRLTGWLRESSATRAGDRWSRLLLAYAAAWVFVNLAPFDITVDLGDLAARVRQGKITIVPFQTAGMSPARVAWDAVAQLLSAVPLGALGLVGFDPRRRRTRALAFTTGLMLVALVELAQVFIRSHAADASDVIAGAVGIGLGVWVGASAVRRSEAAAVPSPAHSVSTAAVLILVVWSAVLCAYHWLPYDFEVNSSMIRRKLARISFLPFAGYGGGSYLNALNNLLVKTALSVPVGAIASFIYRGRYASSPVITAGWLVLAAALFGVIEAGQLLLPGRVPDPTDVLVGLVAAYAGLRIGQWVRPRAL